MIVQKLLSREAALEVNAKVSQLGMPAANKILLAVADKNEDNVMASGIILPGQKYEGVQNRGVIVQRGWLEDENPFFDALQVGNIVTFGDYSGKRVELVDYELPHYWFFVLSINEVSYVENNNF